MVVWVTLPLVPVTVTLKLLAVLGNSYPPPHPVSAVTAPSEATSSTASVIQRLRRFPDAKSSPNSGSVVAASGHVELRPVTAADVATV